MFVPLIDFEERQLLSEVAGWEWCIFRPHRRVYHSRKAEASCIWPSFGPKQLSKFGVKCDERWDLIGVRFLFVEGEKVTDLQAEAFVNKVEQI